jgi:hypothetical protein
MRPLLLIFATAFSLILIATVAQAQNEATQYRYDSRGNCIYTNYKGYETFSTYDVHNNLTYEYSTGTYPQPGGTKANQAVTPVPAATNPAHVVQRVINTGAGIPVAAPIQAPVVVTSVTEAEMQAESDAGAARVKAQREAESKAKVAKDKGKAGSDKANAKSSKRNEFKNGE